MNVNQNQLQANEDGEVIYGNLNVKYTNDNQNDKPIREENKQSINDEMQESNNTENHHQSASKEN